MNLELRLRGESLGFYDPTSDKWLETPADAATIRAEQAEAELLQLREEIEWLKTQTALSHQNSQE